MKSGFGIWITGIPASGKSSITRHLVKKLNAAGTTVVVLESDVMRTILTPEPTYSDRERDLFYRQLGLLGALIAGSGVNVILDATASKRSYRDFARSRINSFVEVFVQCPLELCKQRDPKGIYASAAARQAHTVPGLQAPYEPPLNPELILDGRMPPETNALMILDILNRLLYI
jgi:adenylylsulfate kinase